MGLDDGEQFAISSEGEQVTAQSISQATLDIDDLHCRQTAASERRHHEQSADLAVLLDAVAGNARRRYEAVEESASDPRKNLRWRQ
jgi:hypothetical protein